MPEDTIREDGVLRSSAVDPARPAGAKDPGPAPGRRIKRSRLDGPEAERALSRLREWFDREWQRQAANRYQMALDQDYYDSLQWTEEEAAELLDRGQAPLVFNEVKPTIDWVLGTERQTRIDYRVLAREPEGQPEAEVKTSLLKYLSDTNRAPYARSRAFEDAVKAGLGVIEIGLRGDPSEELIYTRREDWRKVLYDSQSVEPDWSDARYVFRWKWLDEDVAKSYFPGREQVIESACSGESSFVDEEEQDGFYLGARVTEPGHDYQSQVGRYTPYDAAAFTTSRRSRVRVIECWYREPERVRVFRDGELAGEPFDPQDPDHQQYAREGYSLFDNVRMSVKCAIFTDSGMLFMGNSPFDHGRFPFVPVWCYRRARDNAPYGMIRNLRDPQDDLNKRASKALWLLSTNRVTMDEGAVDDIDLLREEVSRPDAVIVKRPGKELRIDRDVQLAQQHVGLMERNIQHIRNLGGVTSENLGRQSNATSGKAIMARQEQGGVVTTMVFDNLREAVQLAGEIELSLVEQYYDEPKVIRIAGDRGAKYLQINEPDPNTGETLNRVTARHDNFIVDEQDYRSSLRIAMFEALFDIVSRLAQMAPMVALNLLDLLVETADVPNRDEMVARIRQLTGMRDPDEEIPPEQEAMMQQQAQAQAAQQAQMQQMQYELTLAKMQAEMAEIVAKADKIGAEAIVTRVQAMYSSLQAAQVAGMAPGAAQAADEIMRSAGFVDPQQQAA
ncbi:MAG: portal protein, partial [Halochromatium sp.]